MKKLFIAMAAVALITGCTSDGTLDMPEIEEQTVTVVKEQAEQTEEVGATTFDIEEQIKYDKHLEFIEVCKILLSVFQDSPLFREPLNEEQLSLLDGKVEFNEEMAVQIIYIWWSDIEIFDCMVEWPDWDDFFPNMPEKYWSIYPFYE